MSEDDRKRYYVSVQAGQILEDPTVAAYELEITANQEEFIRLQELFDELSSMDEAQASHFAMSFFGSASDSQINAGYDGLIARIYKLLHELGTASTKQHIDSMRL